MDILKMVAGAVTPVVAARVAGALGGEGVVRKVIILGATSCSAPAGFAPIAIGLGLTLIHLVSIPVTNTSVNPARSTAVAFFASPKPAATAPLRPEAA